MKFINTQSPSFLFVPLADLHLVGRKRWHHWTTGTETWSLARKTQNLRGGGRHFVSLADHFVYSHWRNYFHMQVSKKDEELTELRMKLEVLQGERQTSEDELNNKLELMKKLNTELSTFKERVTNLAKENEVLEVKVWNVHLCMCPVSLTSY